MSIRHACLILISRRAHKSKESCQCVALPSLMSCVTALLFTCGPPLNDLSIVIHTIPMLCPPLLIYYLSTNLCGSTKPYELCDGSSGYLWSSPQWSIWWYVQLSCQYISQLFHPVIHTRSEITQKIKRIIFSTRKLSSMKKCTQTPISGFSFSTTTFTMKDSYSVCAFYHQLGISLVYWFNLFKTHSVLFLTKIAHISKTRDTVYWFVNKAFEALIQYLQNNFQRNYLYYRVPTFLKNIA